MCEAKTLDRSLISLRELVPGAFRCVSFDQLQPLLDALDPTIHIVEAPVHRGHVLFQRGHADLYVRNISLDHAKVLEHKVSKLISQNTRPLSLPPRRRRLNAECLAARSLCCVDAPTDPVSWLRVGIGFRAGLCLADGCLYG